MVNSYLYHITSLQMHHISSIKSIIISLRGENNSKQLAQTKSSLQLACLNQLSYIFWQYIQREYYYYYLNYKVIPNRIAAQ